MITKFWALETLASNPKFYGILGLVLHRNPGAMLGMFSDLPPLLRIVSLSTGGAFLVFIYAFIQYLLPSKFIYMRAGMSLLLGGILGNVTDRIIWGSVVDFLIIGKPPISTAAFNVADAIQWVGYFLIVAFLIREGGRLWPESNTRKMVWVNPHFQLKYIFVLLTVGLGFSIISGVFSYTYIKVVIDDFVVGDPTASEHRFLVPFLLTFCVISLVFLLVLFTIGRILSHRTAGPLYAFEKYLDELLEGRTRIFRLRAGDEFRHLEELGDRLRARLVPDPADREDGPAPTDLNS